MNKEIVIKKIEAIASNINKPPEKYKKSKFYIREGKQFNIYDEYIDMFEDVLRDVHNHKNWSNIVSEKYIHNELIKIILSIYEKKSNVLNDFDALFSFIEDYSEQNIVYIPISGIVMEPEELSFGNKKLFKITEDNQEVYRKKIEAILLKTKHTDEEKNEFIDIIRNRISPFNVGSIYFRCSYVAEPTKAFENGIEEVNAILDIFRYAIAYLYQDDQRVYINISGINPPGKTVVPIFNQEGTRFNIQAFNSGQLFPLELNEKNLKAFKDIGVFTLCDILTKPERKRAEFERKLLKGIHWFACAQSYIEIENRFLNLITCLETLLTPKDGNPIGTAIAEGVAILVANDLEARKKIKKRVKQLYSVRSAVLHGGKSKILESDINDALNITRSLIMVLIDRLDKFVKYNDLLNFIEAKKLG